MVEELPPVLLVLHSLQYLDSQGIELGPFSESFQACHTLLFARLKQHTSRFHDFKDIWRETHAVTFPLLGIFINNIYGEERPFSAKMQLRSLSLTPSGRGSPSDEKPQNNV